MVFDEVQADLEAIGYEVLPFLLPACAVNAPHRRDRIWFIAYCNGECKEQRGYDEAGQGFLPVTIASSDSERFTTNTDSDKRCKGRLYEKECEKTERHNCTCNTRYGRTNWQNFPTQSPVCSGDDGISGRLDGITFSKWRNNSIKGYGNAIVPQVAYQIFKAIEAWEKLKPTK